MSNRIICVRIDRSLDAAQRQRDEREKLEKDIELFQQELEKISDTASFRHIYNFFSKKKDEFMNKRKNPAPPAPPHEDPKQPAEPKHDTPAEVIRPQQVDETQQRDSEKEKRLQYYDDVHSLREIFENLARAMMKYMEQTVEAEEPQGDQEGGQEEDQGLPEEDQEDSGDTSQDNGAQAETNLPMYYIIRTDYSE